jgi:AhpD family alkylhydroperoxidase
MSSRTYTKKMWTAAGTLTDHRCVAGNIPRILGAYAGPHAIEPKLNEAVMVTVNSVNNCPYCKGLHGELARMAGVEDPMRLMGAQSVDECRQVVDEPAITYARVFAENNGRGPQLAGAFATLVASEGTGRAQSVRALCWFLAWGSLGGNTLNAFLSRLSGAKKTGSSVLFELVFFLYYSPLFLLIALVNAMLRFLPTVPAWFSSFFGVVLTCIASIWILPLGILSVIFRGRPGVLAAG